MTYPNIFICGTSGSGKTTSLRNLPPENTFIINVERKVLPFKGGSRFMQNVHVKSIQEYQTAWRQAITSGAETIIIDSFTSLDEIILKLCREIYKGYDIYSNHNKMVRELIASSKDVKDKFVVFLGIDELVQEVQPDGGNRSKRAIKVEGRELQGTIEKEFAIVLFTDLIKSGDKMQYMFATNTDGVHCAKTPMSMYNGNIPNDLNIVLEHIKKFEL